MVFEQSIDMANPRQPQDSRDLLVGEPLAPQPVGARRMQLCRFDRRQPSLTTSLLEHVATHR
jgi:hypothetical protein